MQYEYYQTTVRENGTIKVLDFKNVIYSVNLLKLNLLKSKATFLFEMNSHEIML